MKNRQTIAFIFKKIKRRIPLLAGMTFNSVARALLSVGFALATKNVLDTAAGDDRAAFTTACIIMLLVIAGMVTLSVLSTHFGDKTRAMLDVEWKKNLLSSILHGKYYKVSAYHSGDILNRMNSDVSTVNTGITSIIPGFASMIVRLVAAVGVMISLEPLLTLVISIIGITVVLVTGALRRKIKELHKATSKANGELSSMLQETAENMLVVRSLNAGDEIEKRTEKLLDNRWRLQRIRKNYSMAANGGIGILCYGIEFIALVWCAKRVMDGEITFGTLTAIVQLVGQLESPFVNFSSYLPAYISMLGSAERLKEIYDIEPEAGEELDGNELYENMDSIVADNIDFVYNDVIAGHNDEVSNISNDDYTLKDFSTTIKKGDFAVVIGPSGAGKSTFLKLLLGIFEPIKGNLYAKNIDGEKITLSKKTRDMFSYAPQGNLLFSGTLRDNLKLTAPDASDETIMKALKIAKLDEFIESLPDGIDTVVGENAEGISEGQAQRINIARAVLADSPIMLLDEISSSLDEQTEKEVLSNLANLPGKTLIAVTHRPQALTHATKTIEIR